jgi:5'-methylthioadenosine phosphorylase
MPSELNYRANIYGMKSLGALTLLSISAVGSMKEDIHPLELVVPDQFYDHTKRRVTSFFGNGIVAHVGMAHPVCGEVAAALAKAGAEVGARVHRGGTYICIEGPQFSTKGESEVYRRWGMSVIGMTNMPEAKLAREAELCYATVAMVTDYDCWHPDHDDVTVDMILKTVAENAAKARELITRVVPGSAIDLCPQGCNRVLDHAVITPPEHRDELVVERLSAVAGRVLNR